jgi:hypothetical protein
MRTEVQTGEDLNLTTLDWDRFHGFRTQGRFVELLQIRRVT